MKERLTEAVLHPWTHAAALVAGLFGVLHPSALGAVAGAVWSQAGPLFTLSSLLGWSLAPRVEWLPVAPLTAVAIGTGALLAAKRGLALYNDFEKRL